MKKNNSNSKNEFKFVIKDVLDIISAPNKGLTLLTNPAGSGKSYETSRFIADKILRSDRPIYYLTPRIKNLDDVYQGIINILKEDGHEDFYDDVVRIDSFRNSIIKNKQLLNEISLISTWDETKDLISNLNLLEDINMPLTTKEKLEGMIFNNRENYEFRFRKKLSKSFRKDYDLNHKMGQSAYDFMKNTEWNFIEQIYPSAKTGEKQVYIMTSKKFFLKNDPIIEEPYFFTEKERIEDALIIIDEFDAIKTDLLDIILNNNFDNDVIDLFGIMYRVFQHIDEMDEHVLRITKSKSKIEKIKKEIDELKEKYFPEKWDVRFYDVNEDTKKIEEMRIDSQIMNYQGIQYFYDERKRYKYVPYRQNQCLDLPVEQQCNKVMPESSINESGEKEYLISNFIKDITWFLNRSFRVFFNMAETYRIMENQRILENKRTDENLISSRNSITTILSKLNFDKDNAIKLAEYIPAVAEYRRYRADLDKDLSDNSVYTKGIYYSAISESDEFRHSHSLYNYEIPYTPELMMLDLSYKAHVIGISATAEVKGLSNFNIDYLKENLDKDQDNKLFHKLPDEYRNALKADYDKKTEGYNNVETKVVKISVSEDCNAAEELARLNSGKENVEYSDVYFIENNTELDNYFDIQCNLINRMQSINDKNSPVIYDFNRLKKVWKYLDKILTLNKSEKVLSNGIIVTEKLIRNGNETEEDIYTLKNLVLGVIYICKRIYEIDFSEAIKMAESMFITINANDLKAGENNNKKYDRFREAFVNESPIFMLTSYSSVSRGNNLQVDNIYDFVNAKISKGDIIPINNWKIKGELDWDSIYIEKPTYMIASLKDSCKSVNYRDKLSLLLAIEEIGARHQISRYDKRRIVNEVFDCIKGERDYFPNYQQLYSCNAVRFDYSSFIYQTIGRISRTNVKKSYNAIFYDEAIISIIEADRGLLNLPIVTNEFARFIEHIKKERKVEFENLLKENNTDLAEKNERMFNFIQTVLEEGNNNGWNPQLQEIWENLRMFILRHPVISRTEIEEAKKTFGNNKLLAEMGFDLNDVYFNFKNKKTVYTFGAFMDDAESHKEGFKSIFISEKKIRTNIPNFYLHEVSEDECRLTALMNNPMLKKYWIEKGYMSKWQLDSNDDYYGIICPVIYNNIYKGAVGEEVVKILLDSIGVEYCNIKDENVYEKFDFVICKNNKRIYIDAKNFGDKSLYSDFANKELETKVNDKVKELSPDYAFIINLIDESGSRNISDKNNVLYIPGVFRCMSVNDCRLINTEENVSIPAYLYEKINEIVNS